MTTGSQGRTGKTGATGAKGQRGKDSAPSGTTTVFVTLTLILVGIVSYQALAFRDFVDRTCGLARVTAQLRVAQDRAYQSFAEQEKTNRFIDDQLRVQRVATWTGLHEAAAATVGPSKKLCP